MDLIMHDFRGCGLCPLVNCNCSDYKQDIKMKFVKDRWEDNWGTFVKVNRTGDITNGSARIKDNVVYCASDDFDYVSLKEIEII